MIKKIPDQIPIHIITDVPRPRKNLQNCALKLTGWIVRRSSDSLCSALELEEIKAWHDPTTNALQQAVAGQNNVKLLDAVQNICSDTACPIFLGKRLIYRDGNHIRRNLSASEKGWFVEKLGFREIFR